MIEALKEYKDAVLTPSFKWIRKHWKGYTVFLIISLVIELLWMLQDDIICRAKNVFGKKAEES